MSPILLGFLLFGQAGGEPSRPAGTLRFGLYSNLFDQFWTNNPGVSPSSGTLPAGLVDYGELYVEPDEGGGGALRFRFATGYRKGGWLDARRQPSPGRFPYSAGSGEIRRDEKGFPSALTYTRDHWLWTLCESFPFVPNGATTQFISRTHLEGRRKENKVDFVRHGFVPKAVGEETFVFKPPDWATSGTHRETEYRSKPIIRIAVTEISKSAALPDADRFYASEFEPFFLDRDFPKKLLKAVEEEKALEFWVLGRMMQIIRVRAYYRGRQQLAFREFDGVALRFDLASFRTNENGTWDVLASVWVSPDDGSLLLADDTRGSTRGFLAPGCLFRPEPERPSDFDFVYPKFVRTERYLKESLEPGGTSQPSKRV